jgi:hypothetical protein
MRDLRL